MIKAYLLTREGVQEQDDIDAALGKAKDGAVLWVDLRNYGSDEISRIAGTFKLHSIEVDSLSEEYTRPHLYDYEDHFHANFTCIDPGQDELRASEFHVFMGRSYIVTASSDGAGQLIDDVLDLYRDVPSRADRGSYYALYLLVDLLTDTYIHAADDMDDEVDNLEDEMSDRADRKTLQHLFQVKRKLFDLRRYLSPQRDVYNQLARGGFAFVEDSHEPYFQDAYNRMSRVFDVIDTSRDILSGTLDLYQSTVSNRLNDIMKILTILAVILGVFSFITGYFGMNLFEPMREPLRVVFWWSLAAGLLIIGVLVYWFRRKGWL